MPLLDLFKSDVKNWHCSDCLSNFCWWCRFYKLKLRATAKRCSYKSTNILTVFETSQENVRFSLDKSPTLSKRNMCRLPSGNFWNVSKVWSLARCLYLCYIITIFLLLSLLMLLSFCYHSREKLKVVTMWSICSHEKYGLVTSLVVMGFVEVQIPI